MAYVAVTLEYGNHAKDLALPMNVPTRQVIDGILQALQLPRKHGHVFHFDLQSDTGLRSISPNASLADIGILHGAVLTLAEQTEADAPPQTGAHLRSETGATFHLGSKITLIGRNDPKSGTFVEIDLSPLATDPKAISRRHAQIKQDGDRFYLTDIGSTNGTKLNGVRIATNEWKPVWDGDIIEFGRNAVQLTFQEGRDGKTLS
jgi:pSer/pThr/pTyr-binding forkhead associated (FHA) protein